MSLLSIIPPPSPRSLETAKITHVAAKDKGFAISGAKVLYSEPLERGWIGWRYVDLWRETGEWNDYCRPLGEDDFECR